MSCRPDERGRFAIPTQRRAADTTTRETLLTRKLLVAAVLVAGVFAFFALDLGRYLTLAALKANRDALRNYSETHYVMSALVFMAIYCAQTALSLPGAAILTLTGGFLFGTVPGTLYVNAGATSGAALAFLAARYLFRDHVERRFGAKLESIQTGFARNAFSYLLTLRLIPLFPFFLVNLASGLTRIRLSTYVAATAIGILPGSVVYANAGRQLGAINSLQDIASPRVVGAFVLLGLLALVPVLYHRLRARSAMSTPSEDI
ncbi:MAG: TVP38/TMEM64 family protein [Nitrospirota bacterium]